MESKDLMQRNRISANGQIGQHAYDGLKSLLLCCRTLVSLTLCIITALIQTWTKGLNSKGKETAT